MSTDGMRSWTSRLQREEGRARVREGGFSPMLLHSELGLATSRGAASVQAR